MSYREVNCFILNQENWREITLNTGGTQSTLQDIKVVEKAGGYCLKSSSQDYNKNKFIYWRSYHDVLELTEISLNSNLFDNYVRIKFSDSSVLSVNIIELGKFLYILVATVNSLHTLKIPYQGTYDKYETNETKSLSIFHETNFNTSRDIISFYVTGQNTFSNDTPHAASSCISTNNEALFVMAFHSNVVLFTMDCSTGQTMVNIFKENNIMPRIFSNLRGALRGKSSTSDSQYATSLILTIFDEECVLLALYRDENIRLWSTSSMQNFCTLSCARDGMEPRSQGPQINTLRKIDETSLCAFLCHSMGSEFLIIKLNKDESSNIYLTRSDIIPAPQFDLVDFEATKTHIWALWCNAQGEFTISSFSLALDYEANWVSVAMEPPPDRYSISVEQGMDPRQAYCSYIFHPGKFEKNVISKALIMFKRSNVLFDHNIPMTILKDRVCQAVESEIQNEIKEFDVNDDEYLEIVSRYWEKFYSCCEQYHIKSCQPVGIFLLNPINLVNVVKKSGFSLLRQCDLLEHLMLSSDLNESSNTISKDFMEDNDLENDVIQLIKILAQIEVWLTDDIKIDFDKKMYQLESPNSILCKTLLDITRSEHSDNHALQEIESLVNHSIKSIKNVVNAISELLDHLRMDYGNPEAMKTYSSSSDVNSRFLMSIGNPFGSTLGLTIISESVRQMALIRYSLCRNLLLFENIICNASIDISNLLDIIKSRFIPETITFVQSYYVMVWISETPVNQSFSSTFDNSIQRLEFLHLTEPRRYTTVNIQSATVLKLFLNGKGFSFAMRLFTDARNQQSQVVRQCEFNLLSVVTVVMQLIWPISGNFIFGDWLFGTCQHLIIQEYVRLSNSWCKWNICSRQFILAVSLLECGEINKAYDLFLQSREGASSEEFLYKNVLGINDIHSVNEINVQFNLKIIQLFEQHNALNYVIALAESTIGVLNQTDPQLPMFQSIVFNNHLILEHYEEAYHALVRNSESSRRQDCLRQLVVCLFNKKRFDILLQFPYIGLRHDFENIMESRARSLSIENNEHYNFLYTFHMNQDNMRKASSIMYEQAMRLLLECPSIDGIKKRYESLLASLSTLSLVNENYQWIAKPVFNDDCVMSSSADGSEKTLKEKVIVLEIQDIKKELLQTEAFLSLAKYRRDISSFLHTGANELCIMLVNCGLYTSSIKLATGFNISLTQIFESLAAACVNTSEQDVSESWAWLQENEIADLPNKSNACDIAWLLLENLIEENENIDSTEIRKAVANKLLSLGAFLPQWLLTSYKLTNAPELLRLYVKHGRLIEATDLAKEYISALLGRGTEYFNLKNFLTSNAPAMCFPVHTIDLLLYGLKANSEDIDCNQCFLELSELVECYLNTASRVSEDKIKLEYQNAIAHQSMNTT